MQLKILVIVIAKCQLLKQATNTVVVVVVVVVTGSGETVGCTGSDW